MYRSELVKKIVELTDNKWKVYLIGFLLSMGISILDVIQASYNNFQIFSYGSSDFWNGINPYIGWNHLSLRGKALDIFLYTPLFSILFTPLTLLPDWLGVLCWNLLSYTLFYFSVITLPEQFTFAKKRFIIFYSTLLLLQTLFSEQFNPVITALFLISFTLMEKNKSYWAVFFMLISGFTKVYGFFQLGMLLFYPRFWKNMLFALVIAAGLFVLPVVKIPLHELLIYYKSWIDTVINHSSNLPRFDIIYRPFYLLFSSIKPFTWIISIGILVALYYAALLKLELFKESFTHRARFLGILMVWVILLGMVSERNTYHIALVGYAMWYTFSQTSRTDKILLWINFVLLEVVTIDLFCPRLVAIFLLETLNLGVLTFAITWGIMVYKTFTSDLYNIADSRTASYI